MQTKHALIGSEEYVPVGIAAKLLGVSNDTVKRWEKAGRISAVRTPTGHRRFRRSDVEALLTARTEVASA